MQECQESMWWHIPFTDKHKCLCCGGIYDADKYADGHKRVSAATAAGWRLASMA